MKRIISVLRSEIQKRIEQHRNQPRPTQTGAVQNRSGNPPLPAAIALSLFLRNFRLVRQDRSAAKRLCESQALCSACAFVRLEWGGSI